MNKERIFPLQIYPQDTDMFGMVHHANHIRFMERARSEWLLERGIDLVELLNQGIYLVIHSININYLKPIFFNDAVEIVTKEKRFGRVSMEFVQTFRSQINKDLVYCNADIKIACIDKNSKPHAIHFLKNN